MERHSIEAELRTETGKGAARKIRRNGLIPGVVYGRGNEPRSIKVDPLDIEKLLILLLNKKNFFLAVLIICLMSPMLQAEDFESPEAFTEYIYANYAEEDFVEVYDNFAAELKRILKKNKYLEFQEKNFKKYNLK